MMLFWLKPSRQIRPPIYSLKQARLRKRMVRNYLTLYFLVFAIFVAIIAGPAAAAGQVNVEELTEHLPEFAEGLIQPRRQDNNDTGNNNTWGWTYTPSTSSWSTKA